MTVLEIVHDIFTIVKEIDSKGDITRNDILTKLSNSMDMATQTVDPGPDGLRVVVLMEKALPLILEILDAHFAERHNIHPNDG